MNRKELQTKGDRFLRIYQIELLQDMVKLLKKNLKKTDKK